ncbi:MAG: helix-turn-helix domain-containing protein, partial [Oscillospiraceae bacterium]
MTLYEKIDFLCKTNGITRKELARQTGISYATLNAMFARQSTNISLETIRAIANH